MDTPHPTAPVDGAGYGRPICIDGITETAFEAECAELAHPQTTIDYTAKVDALLAHAAKLGFAEHDFADLAIAAADQAGASPRDQDRIAAMLGKETR